MISSRLLCMVLCLPGSALLSGPAFGQTASAVALPGFVARAADTATLASQRGGTQVRNDMVLSGTTADNSASHVATGNNAINAGAFANMSGLPVVIQNSGANVLIQSAVILNLQMN
jgi:hypothetical protein